MSAALAAQSRGAPLIAALAGVAIGNAGLQLRLAVQGPSAPAHETHARLRWLAAALLVLGATLVGAGLALVSLRAAAL